MDKIVHALVPVATIGAVTALAALRIIDPTSAIVMLSTVSGLGTVAVKSGTSSGPSK